MGKAAKEHRKKVQARNGRIKQQKEKVKNMQKDLIMNMIRQEQEKGMFDNNPNILPISDLNLPDVDTTIEGPSI